ncbi:MAG TPA: isoprenylcysteine carboxylmethyltransferase family protein [Chitinophagaceae bacterium]|nr:isoprenylcysteine carboxylmethyltransferase family protein [Chitinophagaceae bacterium]
MAFALFISFVVLLRLAELYIAARNERRMRLQGAVEYGSAHYPVIVCLHTFFFVSLLVEYCLFGPHSYHTGLIALYLLLVLLKAWVISSLGRFWNTRILRIPGTPLVANGPYRFVKHPNYIIVVAELIIIPMTFDLYRTAIVFSLLNAAMLYVRIGVENRALKDGRPE